MVCFAAVGLPFRAGLACGKLHRVKVDASSANPPVPGSSEPC